MIHLSIIVPTKNRSSLLLQTLNSVIHQSYPEEGWEVIVVDNGSTDDTKLVCDSIKPLIKNFTYIYDCTPGLHAGRHRGLEVAKGDILVFIDDDIKALPQWLEGINESFEDQKIAMVGGKNIPLYEVPPPTWERRLWEEIEVGRYNTFYSLLDFGNKEFEISPFFIWGCNFSIRKEVLLSIGGFHPDGMPKEHLRFRGDGETAVSNKILEMNYKAVYNPKASVEHWVSKSRLTLNYIYQRAFNQGISDSYTRIRSAHLGSKTENKSSFSTWMSNTKQLLIDIKKISKEKILFKDPVEYYKIKGYRAGFYFHQKEVKKDFELLKWIIKPSYIN